ncbi:alanine racemase [Kineococcus terrestris]|uniref:alanine racemase n=1 Tax=Kineococcus terrestris TaxID=2044856 RepID=UPI0034DACD7B
MTALDALDTPFLVVDRAVLRRNVERRARWAADAGVALRPHAKTHKSAHVAAAQLAAGAVGLTVATVGEAEHFAAAGAGDLFLAYPVWAGGARGERLRALAGRVRLRVGVDSAEGARQLAAACGDLAEVAVEVDSGHHRTGVTPDRAAGVALAAARAGLRVAGVFTFPGHSYAPGAPADVAAQELAALTAASEGLRAAGLDAPLRSGGSTPTAGLAAEAALDEVRPGVYVFGDAQQVELGLTAFEDVSLWAEATVVSRRDGVAVLDAGSKVLGRERAAWASGYARLPDVPGARVVALSEHHATVDLGGARVPAVGERVRVVPNHVCLAVNLVDELVAVGPEGVERWPVGARGLNS